MSTPKTIGRFKIESVLGSGAYGAVYRALDPKLGRRVAIKVLNDAPVPPELAAQENQTVDLFPRRRHRATPESSALVREARALARVSHPNVLPIYEIGGHRGAVFLVTEFVDGRNGRDWLVETEPRAKDVDEVLRIFRQVGAGLAAAHDRNILHRDIKPENLLLGIDGRVRIADFGISSDKIARADRRPHESTIEGTPGYIAPEVLLGQMATKQADTFAFAVTLTEALLGTHPSLESQPDRSRTRRLLQKAGVPRKASDAITAALSPEPSRRPPLRGLLAALETRSKKRLQLSVLTGICIGGGLIVWGLSGDKPQPPCGADQEIYRWSGAEVSQLERIRKQSSLEDVDPIAARVRTALEETHRELERLQIETCKLLRQDKLTTDDFAARRSCFGIAMVAFADIVERLDLPTTSIPQLADLVVQLPVPSECVQVDEGGKRAQNTAARKKLLKAILELEGRHAGTTEGIEAEIAELSGLAAEGERLKDAEAHVRATRDIGSRLQQLGRVDEAEATYDVVIELAHRAKLFDFSTDAELSMVSIELSRGDLEAAGRAYKRASTDVSKFAARPRIRAHVLKIGARLEARKGRPDAAIEFLLRAREFLEKDHNIAMVFGIENELANVLKRAGKVDAARDHYVRAIAAGKEYLGSEHPTVAGIEANLASALRELGDLAEARNIQERLLPVIEDSRGIQHNVSLRLRNNLARTFIELGDLGLAEEQFRHTISQTESGGEPVLRAFALHGLVGLEFRLGRAKSARHLIEKTLTLIRNGQGPDQSRLVIFLVAFAEMLAENGAVAKATSLLIQARAILEKRTLNAHNVEAMLLQVEADIAFRQRRFDDATAKALAGVEMVERKQLPLSIRGSCLVTVARVKNARGEFAKARAAATKAIDAWSQLSPRAYVKEIAFASFQAARADYALGNERGLAIRVAQKALDDLRPAGKEIKSRTPSRALEIQRWLAPRLAR